MTVSVSSVADVRARIARAHDVAFGTYFLGAGPMRDALAAAARRGAHVEVTMQDAPYRDDGSREKLTLASAQALRAAGAQVTLLPRETAPFHLKAAVCDGVAFLDDRNWARDEREVVVADTDPRDVSLIRDALHGHAGANAGLAARKDTALARETALIEGAPRDSPVTVETETLGASVLSAALRRRALSGAPTTLIVGSASARDARERALLRGLRKAGVSVHTRGVNEKLALAGDRAWVGSANATRAFGATRAQIDWGMVTSDAGVVGAVRTALARDLAR